MWVSDDGMLNTVHVVHEGSEPRAILERSLGEIDPERRAALQAEIDDSLERFFTGERPTGHDPEQEQRYIGIGVPLATLSSVDWRSIVLEPGAAADLLRDPRWGLDLILFLDEAL